MHIDLDLMIQNITSSTQNIHRDYLELLNLQSSNSDTTNFVERTISRATEKLERKFDKYFDQIIIAKDFNPDEIKKSAIWIDPIEGVQNFQRAIPFFATLVTILQRYESKLVVEQAIIDFPILKNTYSVQKGGAVFVDTYHTNMQSKRVRASSVSNLDNAVIATDLKHLPMVSTMSPHVRIFDSVSYNLALLISGNIDAIILSDNNLFPIMNSFVSAAGGLITKQNNVIVASNALLHDKILRHFTK